MRACGTAGGRFCLASAYVWHQCMCAGVRASGRWEARRPGGVGHEGAHYAPRDSPSSIATANSLSVHCSGPGRSRSQEEAAAPPQIPGGAAPAPARLHTTGPDPPPPAVQSLPVKSTSSMDGVAAGASISARVRACVRACLHLRQHRSVPPCARADSVHVH